MNKTTTVISPSPLTISSQKKECLHSLTLSVAMKLGEKKSNQFNKSE